MPIRYTPGRGNGSGGGNTSIGVSAGVPTAIIPAGTTLYYVLLFDGTNHNAIVSIGYTPGGTEVLDNVQLNGGFASETLVIAFPTAKTLYITSDSAFTTILFKVNF